MKYYMRKSFTSYLEQDIHFHALKYILMIYGTQATAYKKSFSVENSVMIYNNNKKNLILVKKLFKYLFILL